MNIGILVISFISIISVIIAVKTAFFYYINLQLMIVFSNLSYDIAIILLIIVFRPQKLPAHFSVTFDVHEGEREFKPINIFFAKLKKSYFFKNDSIVLNNLSANESKEVLKNLEIPIAVLNPYDKEFKGILN
jgi:hypothetical protein